VGFDLKSVGSDRKNRGVSPNRVWGLTEISEGPNDHSTEQHNDFLTEAARLSYVLIYFSHSSALCVLFEKESRRDQGTNDGTYPFVPLSDLLRTGNSLRVLNISPRICRACRPTPCPHFACNADAKASSIAKARRSWGLSADFALGQNRRPPRLGTRRLRSSPVGCGARLVARGRPATPDAVA
jgi:hypothetical protein